MTKLFCGIDFGTSNSSVAVTQNDIVTLIPVEGAHVTIPSAIYLPPASISEPTFGRDAIQKFFERKDGRFMRSLKRILGTSFMKHGTVVNGRPLKFERIISLFLQNLKLKTDAHLKQQVEHVVLGRPVHFVDNDDAADQSAQSELKSIAQLVGYRHIEFQFEPIAAAFAHEINISGEKLAIVADLGGGTSDFTIIRLSSKYTRKADRSSDILANAGIRVGGNDFDKCLTLSSIMPELGYLSTYGTKHLEVPLKYYHDLAEWSKVNFLYTAKVLSQVRQFYNESDDKKRFGRLLKVLEQERGHSLLAAAEDTKIMLTEQQQYERLFEFIEPGLAIAISRGHFEDSISSEVKKITSTAKECLAKAGLIADDIDLVILTGGSTEIPIVQSAFRDLFPEALVADENKLSSVALGLAYDSFNKFG